MGRNKKKTEEEITKIEDDKGEQPDDTERNKKKTEEEITKIEDDKEMCPDIKKWLLGGSLENNCYYTGSGCPRCFGKTYRCSFDYKKKGCDKKTITNKKDAVQELVDMELISEEEKTKIEGKKGVLRTIKTWKIHCTVVKKKGEIRLQKQLQKSKKARMTHRTKLLEKKKKRKKQNSSQRKLNRNRPQKTKKKKIEKTTIFNKQDAEKKKKIKAYQDKKKKRTETEKNKERRKN